MQKYINSECERTVTTKGPGGGSAPDRYVCEEGGVATNGFYRCIVDNAKKYPLARSCGTVNNIYISGGKIVNYNTGCAIKKPVTPPAAPIGFCNIIAFQ